MPRKYTTEERINAFWNKVAITADDNQCWEWKAMLFPNGYGRMKVGGKDTLAHRIAWMHPNYIIPKGMCVCHSCDNPKCCNPKHLWLGTNQENTADKVSKNRQTMGESVNTCKLSPIQVVEVRLRYASGETNSSKLAREFGISAAGMRLIIKRINWKQV